MREVFEQTLLNAQASGTGAWIPVNSGAEHLAFFAEWSAGGSGGVLVLEECWVAGNPVATISTITQAGASVADVVRTFGVYRLVRARLSTPVTGGTVTVRVVGATAG